MTEAERPVVEVRDLKVSYQRGQTKTQILGGVDLTLRRGEIHGLVGESGSGKSTLGLSLTRLVEHKGGLIHANSSIRICGIEIVGVDDVQLQRIRREEVSMVFQDALTALNPVQTVGQQIGENLRGGSSPIPKKEIRSRAIDLLRSTGIRQPEKRVDNYPHELSGGMRQRAMIAMALAPDPALIVADEPTTALDTTVRRTILDLIAQITHDRGIAMLLITHDMATVAHYTDRTAVMYAGRVVEVGTTRALHRSPQHPYSAALIQSVPRLGTAMGTRLTSIRGRPPDPASLPDGCSFHPRCPRNDRSSCVYRPPIRHDLAGVDGFVLCNHPGSILESEFSETQPGASSSLAAGLRSEDSDSLVVNDLGKRYRLGRRGLFGKTEWMDAAKQVSFEVQRGETLGLVGESGSGKTTVARCIALLTTPTSGSIRLGNSEITNLKRGERRKLKRDIQIVFQNPSASLDPRWRVGALIAEPMRIHGLWETEGFGPDRVAALLERVGLSAEDADRYPHEFSIGQRQRIALARALSVGPSILILDEPVSSLDVSIRAGVINLLKELQQELNLGYLFIAHDLPLVAAFCQRVAVMHLGRIVEIGEASQVLTRPQDPYTKRLIEAEL